MVQIVDMTHEEKVQMYNRLTKAQIIEMLIESNRVIESMPTGLIYNPQPTVGYNPVTGWREHMQLTTVE